MTTVTTNVIRQELRENKVLNIQASKVQANKESINKEILTLPEIKLNLDDILKQTKLKYSVDGEENDFIIKVMDKKTDKIIKEIPSHDIQVLRKHFRTHMGVLFNELI